MEKNNLKENIMKLLSILGRAFTVKVFTKSYWIGPFPEKYHDECFMCKRTDCSKATCDKNIGSGE